MTTLSVHGGEKITGQRVSARVSSCGHRILRPSRLGDDKAVLAAHVAEIQVGVMNVGGACESSRSHCSRVVARAAAVGGRVLGFCRSVDEEAVMVARVPRIRSGSQESKAVRGRFSGDNCGAWRRV